MAYLQSRSNIARSGVTYCGWTPPSVAVTIGGTTRSSSVLTGGATLTTRADGTPPTFRFTTKNITPVVGQDVKVAFATPDDYLFGGTILQREISPFSSDTGDALWDCVAVGYQWLLDRYDYVLAQYESTGVDTIVADILYRFTNGGFVIGYIQSSLGNLTIEFTFETVYGALQRIARAVGAVLEITPERVVNIFVAGTYPEAALTTVTQLTAHALTYREDLTQVRTRTLYQGSGSSVASPVAGGAAVIPVTDVGPFSSSGGYAVSGRSLITYTGVSTGSGAGNLTGCSGLLYDLAANDEISLLVQATDATATTALATILGGGLSGQATNYLQDGRLSISEATARATADLATFSGSLDEVSFTYKTPQRYVRAGRLVTLNITAPFTLSGTFTLQSVELKPYGVVSGSRFEMIQSVECSGFTRTLNDLLLQLNG